MSSESVIEQSASERVYFREEPVLVTNARFVNGNQTFAMRNVSSVTCTTSKSSILAPVIMILIGLVAAAGNIVVGGLIIAGAVCWFIFTGSKHVLMLTAAGSVQTGLESRDEELVKRVASAINQAIIDRG